MLVNRFGPFGVAVAIAVSAGDDDHALGEHEGLNILEGHFVLLEQLAVGDFGAAQGLNGAIAAATHGAVGIGFALHTAVEANHHKHKGQHLGMIFFEGEDTIYQFLPIGSTLIAQMWDDVGWEHQFVASIHRVAIPAIERLPLIVGIEMEKSSG